MEELARLTFHDSPLRSELEKRVEELEAENLGLKELLRVQQLQQEARDQRDIQHHEQALQVLKGSGMIDWDGRFGNYIYQVSTLEFMDATYGRAGYIVVDAWRMYHCCLILETIKGLQGRDDPQPEDVRAPLARVAEEE